MKTQNDLASGLTEAELDDVRGGQANLVAPLAELTRRVEDVAESIDRLAVFDARLFEPLLPRSPLGSLVPGAAADVPELERDTLILRGS